MGVNPSAVNETPRAGVSRNGAVRSRTRVNSPSESLFKSALIIRFKRGE